MATPNELSNDHYHIEKDVFETSAGKLTLYFIGHSSLMLEINKKTIYTDPVSALFDYSKLPKADIILITHIHPDHFDINAINKITQTNTQIIVTPEVYEALKKGIVLKNGDKTILDGIEIEAIPAYNTSPDREKFHTKGIGNGYVLNLGNKKIYIAGDTENIPEMKLLKNIDIAFLPMNLPYTMTPEMVADAAKSFNPAILYPYHYGNTNTEEIVKLLKNSGIEVRIRNLK